MPASSRPSLVLALIIPLALSGCVEKSRELNAAQRERLRELVRREPTTPERALGVAFEDKVELVGVDLSADRWRPGSTLTVTWHWKVDRALEEGWNLFTHVTDSAGNNLTNADQDGPMRELYPPGRGKAGDYVLDRQAIALPPGVSASEVKLFVGLWKGNERLGIVRGPNDGDDRAPGATLPTGAPADAPAAPEGKEVDVPRLGGITLDGVLDEPAWQRAANTGVFVNTLTGGQATFTASARVGWDDDNLYVAFEVADDYLKSAFRERDDHLWEADVVEIMADPGGDGRNYFEMQVSPRNVVFDTRYDTRRNPGPIGHADWDSGLRSAVALRGEVDDDDEDQGYTVEIAIPWASFAAGTPPASRPAADEVWRVNFYVMDAREAGQRAAAWSPPRVGDFHVPARFGALRFAGPADAEEASAGAVPAATAPAVAAPTVAAPNPATAATP